MAESSYELNTWYDTENNVYKTAEQMSKELDDVNGNIFFRVTEPGVIDTICYYPDEDACNDTCNGIIAYEGSVYLDDYEKNTVAIALCEEFGCGFKEIISEHLGYLLTDLAIFEGVQDSPERRACCLSREECLSVLTEYSDLPKLIEKSNEPDVNP